MKIHKSFPAILAALIIAALPIAAPAQVSVGIGVGFNVGSPPPPIPYYAQPPAPYPNYQWTPGYWAYGPAGYYWVPGTWVAPPSVGLYWTPGYWGYNNGYYGFNQGYWGASVGFYGGINYGYGYPGTGFYGGAWNGGAFSYNTAVANVNRTVIHNTYNKTVINNGNFCKDCKNVSFNGGKGGTTARPTQAQLTARRNGRAPTTDQKNQARLASEDRNQLASVNKGRPTLTASQKPFNDTNKPSNFAPVTAADKQMAAKNNATTIISRTTRCRTTSPPTTPCRANRQTTSRPTTRCRANRRISRCTSSSSPNISSSRRRAMRCTTTQCIRTMRCTRTTRCTRIACRAGRQAASSVRRVRSPRPAAIITTRTNRLVSRDWRP